MPHLGGRRDNSLSQNLLWVFERVFVLKALGNRGKFGVAKGKRNSIVLLIRLVPAIVLVANMAFR